MLDQSLRLQRVPDTGARDIMTQVPENMRC